MAVMNETISEVELDTGGGVCVRCRSPLRPPCCVERLVPSSNRAARIGCVA